MQRRKATQEYYESLNAQIKTDKQRKKYDILMTEHERRVHDKAIKAYEYGGKAENETSGALLLGRTTRLSRANTSVKPSAPSNQAPCIGLPSPISPPQSGSIRLPQL